MDYKDYELILKQKYIRAIKKSIFKSRWIQIILENIRKIYDGLKDSEFKIQLQNSKSNLNNMISLYVFECESILVAMLYFLY